MGDVIEVATGLSTSDNNRFLRFWHEVSFQNIEYNGKIKESNRKWFPMAKGGLFRKWYGNNEYVINYGNDGKEIKDYAASLYKSYSRTIKNIKNYGREGMTWSALTTGSLSMRYMKNSIFGSGASCAFTNGDLLLLMALLNSKIVDYFMKYLNPTINVNVTELCKIPVVDIDNDSRKKIDNLVAKNINLCKQEYDSYEISKDFASFNSGNEISIKNYVDKEIIKTINSRDELKINEETINDILINAYDLCDTISKEIDDKYNSINMVDSSELIKRLISYYIGLIMGRYSLSHEGLVYAGGMFDKTKYGNYVDEDGIVPIYQYIGIEGGLAGEICKLVREIYGDVLYKDNISFIAEALGRRSDESAEETINKYLNDSFYNDHLKMYQKRPIYWMLSSGKMGAFKCLIYLHRYNKDTLGLINSKYFLPRTAMYKAERERLEGRLASGQLDAREKKNVENELDKVIKCQEELLEYGQVLDHLANQYIELDLDDGVKENYVKFQGVKLQVNGATIKKDLLVPFGLEKK